MMFAEIAPAIPLKPGQSPAFYTYRVPRRDQGKLQVGAIVQIPLGPRRVAGTILRLHQQSVPYPTKPLKATDRASLTAEQLSLAMWLSTTLHSGLGYTLRLFFPPPAAPKIKSPPKKDAAHAALQKNPEIQLVLEKSDNKRHTIISRFVSAATTTQALIIVPEVGMIPPLQKMLSHQFPAVYSYHSDHTQKELSTVWQHVYEGRPIVVIGTQKTLFLPWRSLSHLVLEEEYIETHKLWDQYPRLDNRYAARHLAAIHSSQLLVSSSVESLATIHDRQRSALREKAHAPVVPKIKIVPLTFDDRRQGHFLPPEIITALKMALRQHQRTIILHNQRGSWRTAVCNKCHQALRCPKCESTVFVEGTKTKQRIHCRHCAYTGPVPEACPQCHSKNLRVFGPGATKIAGTLQALLPRASIASVSAGAAEHDGDVSAADIVLGTTAIWRHAPEGSFDHALWLFPESTLLYPDYRSSERAWHILARLQKAIPTRRRVTVVTRYPDLANSSLAASSEKIITQLLRERQRLHYPPFTDLVKLSCLARTEGKSLDRARAAREKIDAVLTPGVIIRGPYQGFNKKDGKHFAAHILLAGRVKELVPLYKDLVIDRAELSPSQIL